MLIAKYFWLMKMDAWEVSISLQLEPWQVTTIFLFKPKKPPSILFKKYRISMNFSPLFLEGFLFVSDLV